jgi:hypothetical protein
MIVHKLTSWLIKAKKSEDVKLLKMH